MDGFCLLYLLLILLMRSGDVKTNPGPNTAVSTVSEMEFLKLAQDIAPSYYNAVGISLGIPHAQLQAILVENLKNYPNALMDVFMKWNIKQPLHSNKRQFLADKLREIDLGSLSDGLLLGPLIPNSTGEPSRLSESQTKPPSADSQTKPLSPELVERCANDFKFKYRSTVCKIRADPLKPSSLVGFEKRHANLVLEEEDGTGKQTIDYNDILDLRVNGEFPKRIMVQGEAGAGKTTFCAKIAWEWMEGEYFSDFVWVLIVPLREFKQHSIGEIAKSYLDKNNPATVSQITEYIRSNPDKVFIAIDGLNEVSGKIMNTESCESQPTDQMQLQPTQPSVSSSSEACGSSSGTGDIGLVDILCSDQLASCPVLVTTRPWRTVEVRSDGDLMKLYTFIHVKGLPRPPASYPSSSSVRQHITPRATQHAIDTSSYSSKPTSLYSSRYGSPSTTTRDAYRPHRPEISRRTTTPITATYEPKTYSDAYSTKYASRSLRPEQRSPSVSSISRDLLRLPLMDDSPSRTYKSSRNVTLFSHQIHQQIPL